LPLSSHILELRMLISKKILDALAFAAEKHAGQLRKGGDVPYINHPIKVANILADNGESTETELIMAAILHDVIEDTDATPEELEILFGKKVKDLVMECTDDKTQNKASRKQAQIDKAPFASDLAKKLKLADKICNVVDIRISPPSGWSKQRKEQYLDWSDAVFCGLKGVSPKLEELLESELKISREALLKLTAG